MLSGLTAQSALLSKNEDYEGVSRLFPQESRGLKLYMKESVRVEGKGGGLKKGKVQEEEGDKIQ